MKKLMRCIGVLFLFLALASQCAAQESPEEHTQQVLPENYEYPWIIEFDGKFITRNTKNPNLTLVVPDNVIVRLCTSEAVPLRPDLVGNKANLLIQIVQDEKSETGVRYEVREIQTLCD